MSAFGEVNDVSRKSIEGISPESYIPLLLPFQTFSHGLSGMFAVSLCTRSGGNLARGPGASVMIVIGGPLPVFGLFSSPSLGRENRKTNSVLSSWAPGARESLETAPGTNKLILGNRKAFLLTASAAGPSALGQGFVKLALQKGASLVPARGTVWAHS